MASRWHRFRAACRARPAVRRALAGSALALSLLGSAASARADAIDDWSLIALDAAVAESPDLDQAAYTLATVHAAMFEALLYLGGPDTAAYTPRYTVRGGPARGPVSWPGIIAAVAAHQVLLHAFPRQARGLIASLGLSMAAISARSTLAAVVVARSVADIVRAVRGSGDAETVAKAVGP
ncbi:MAG: hypothetical protein OEY03_11435 [Rhizobacter sp.]|nr:hypothetical protein [Rhizobacter sp.]